MTRKIISILLLTLSSLSAATACDICGCGAGSYYIGILPEFNSKIIGVRYRSNSIITHLGPRGEVSYQTTDEQYHTTEVWGGWTIKERFRIMGYIPVSHNIKTNELGTESKTGPGDIGLQGLFRLVKSKQTTGNEKSTKLLVQDLWVGGGFKLPTGKYETSDNSQENQSANLFQLGTGSFDFMLTGMYDIRWQDLGLNITASYKINTTNRYDYYYGNRLSASSQLYYKIRLKNKWSLAPNIGFSYEHSMKDLDEGYYVRPTGGQAGFGTTGMELTASRFLLGGNWQPVLLQQLGAGAVRTNNRFMVHVSYLF